MEKMDAKANNVAKKRVYLSLPISGYDLEERKETAMKMEVKFRGMGYDVLSPLGGNWIEGLTTNEYMRRDIEMLLTCDIIFLMNGWNASAGCHTELCVAMACGLQVMFENLEKVEL